MSRYVVVWTRDAIDQLSKMWIAGPDRQAITQSVTVIDQVLATEPFERGYPVHEGLWFLEGGCLRVLYSRSEHDGAVEVARVARR